MRRPMAPAAPTISSPSLLAVAIGSPMADLGRSRPTNPDLRNVAQNSAVTAAQQENQAAEIERPAPAPAANVTCNVAAR